MKFALFLRLVMKLLKKTIPTFLLLLSLYSFSQESDTKYYGREYFLLEGTGFDDSEKEIPYQRIPKKYKTQVRSHVWDISECPSGMSVRFVSNSKKIRVKWEVAGSRYIGNPNMATTGMKGIDLYFKENEDWRYVTSGNLMEKNWGDKLLIKNMDGEKREYKIYLPLYYRLIDIEIGIDAGATIEKAKPRKEKPIVFYGTSITQGGSASRTGMAHTNIIERTTGNECINFGFRGNGIMEPEIAEIMAEIDAQFFVIECIPNMSKKMILERTRPLVETIRKKHKTTPIILVDGLMDEKAILNQKIAQQIKEKNEALENQYNAMIKDNFEHLYLIKCTEAIGNDHEATVDGIHFTDLGFLRYANHLITQFRQQELLK